MVSVGWDGHSTKNRRVRLHVSLKAVLLGRLQGSQNQKGKDVLLMAGAMNFSNCQASGAGAGFAKQLQSEFRVSVWEAIELGFWHKVWWYVCPESPPPPSGGSSP